MHVSKIVKDLRRGLKYPERQNLMTFKEFERWLDGPRAWRAWEPEDYYVLIGSLYESGALEVFDAFDMVFVTLRDPLAAACLSEAVSQ